MFLESMRIGMIIDNITFPFLEINVVTIYAMSLYILSD